MSVANRTIAKSC